MIYLVELLTDILTILHYSNEIRSAVLLVHGEKVHSCYFSRGAFVNMTKNSKYTDNKELMINRSEKGS